MTETGTNRRRFMSLCISVLMPILVMALAIPALAYFWASLRRKWGGDQSGQTLLDVGPLSDFPLGEWHFWAVETMHGDGWKKTRVRQAIWVRRHGDGDRDVSVLSSICPHMGCLVNWYPDKGQFACPCHGGIFQTDGQHVAGPPPRRMDALDFEVRGGRLFVRWQDFKIGVPQRTPVNA
jgi:Rieske Fe-S protein